MPWHRSPRVKLFAIAFISVAITGLAYTFSQPTTYQSRASLLMAPMTAVDRISAMAATRALDRVSVAADTQHVAIQNQILLGSELLARTHTRMEEAGYPGLPAAKIRELLQVEPVADTNLVEMIADGSDPAVLPVLISTLIDVYLAARKADIEQTVGDAHQILSEEMARLAQTMERARRDLADFRHANNIVSAERAENEALARLNGINESLNTALEAEVQAGSELDTIRESIAAGKTLVPQDDRKDLNTLEVELQKMRAKLSDLDAHYTREYLARQPGLRALPEQITELEGEIAHRKELGQQAVLYEAQQAYSLAARVVVNIRQQFEEHRREVEKFTQTFLVHQSLVGDMENLEELHRLTQARLVRMDASQIQKYPQVNVIAAASLAVRTGPNYGLNSLIALVVALLGAIIVVWLASFLGHQQPADPAITLTGIHMYPEDAREALGYRQKASVALEKQPGRALEQKGGEGKTPGSEDP